MAPVFETSALAQEVVAAEFNGQSIEGALTRSPHQFHRMKPVAPGQTNYRATLWHQEQDPVRLDVSYLGSDDNPREIRIRASGGIRPDKIREYVNQVLFLTGMTETDMDPAEELREEATAYNWQ
ncbi:MAG: hypothetical protein ABH879_01110 [archaeon]